MLFLLSLLIHKYFPKKCLILIFEDYRVTTDALILIIGCSLILATLFFHKACTQVQ